MLFRHSGVRWPVASTTWLAVGAAACATSVQDREHGPEYGADGGADVTPDGGGDATADAARDGARDATGADSPADTAADAGPEADSPSCLSTMALVGASQSATVGASYSGGQWSAASPIAGGAAAAAPSIVSLGTVMVAALTHAGDGKLESAVYSGSWSAASPVGAALSQGTPALAVVGADAHVVYWGGNGKFYHGVYHANAWDAASDPVGGDESQSFGSSAPAAAGMGASNLLAVQAGSDGTLYDQSWNGAWGMANAQQDATVVKTITPAVVALSGGSADAMIALVHVDDAGAYFLQYTVHGGNGWSAAADVYDMNGNVAYTGFTPSLAALPGGRAVLVWLGANPAYPYFSVYDPQKGWSAPAPVAGVALSSPPSVAPGVCGADAVVALVPAATGDVRVSTLSGGTWSSPAPVAGTTGSTWAAVASSP